MWFSIIIPIFNTHNLWALIENILSTDIYHYDYEIIIIDDGSDKKYFDSYKKSLDQDINIMYHYLWDKQWRYRIWAAKNAGVKISNYKTLVFLDQESFIHKTYFQSIVENYTSWILWWAMLWFNDRNKYLSKEIQQEFFDSWNISDPNFLDIRNESLKLFSYIWAQVFGTNMICDKATYIQLDWFDENYIWWWIEDQDLCYRAFLEWIPIEYNDRVTLLNLWDSLYNGIGIISEKKKLVSWSKNLQYFLSKYNSTEVQIFVKDSLYAYKEISKKKFM